MSKHEERQIKAMFITGIVEWMFKLTSQHIFNYDRLWIQVMGGLGTGMIIYSIALGYYVRRNK